MIVKLSIMNAGDKLMFKKGFSIFKLIGFVAVLAVVLFLVFKASISGSIV